MASKWSFKQLKEEYTKLGINFNDIFKKIKDVCIKALMAVEPEIAYQTSCVTKNATFKGQCFEVYGFDILIDSSFKPWLLEVNVAPSLSSSSPYDKMVKTMLLSDTLHLVGFNVFDRKHLEEERKEKKRNQPPGPFTKIEKMPKSKDSDTYLSPLHDIIKQRMIQMNGNYSSKRNLAITDHAKDSSSPTKFKVKDKIAIPSFLEGFNMLTEDDLEVLATFEEE